MMMKLTFEGATLGNILDEMHGVLERFRPSTPAPAAPLKGPVTTPGEVSRVVAQEARPPIVDKPVDKPVEKKARTEKQLANDEKMRVAALAKIEAKRAAKAQSQAYATNLRNDLNRDPIEKPVEETPDPFVQDPEAVDPAELVNIRLKTIEELQAAFGNGHHKEVMELLSRFGNGARSFRELKPEAFLPIRRAIDLGALE